MMIATRSRGVAVLFETRVDAPGAQGGTPQYMAEPNLDELYLVLRNWATARGMGTYTELARDYQARTGDWFEPHGSWDAPLGRLNQRLHAVGAPALSALVVLASGGEPGGGFWGSAPSVPSRPKAELDRLSAWTGIVNLVHAHPWPVVLP